MLARRGPNIVSVICGWIICEDNRNDMVFSTARCVPVYNTRTYFLTRSHLRYRKSEESPFDDVSIPAPEKF